MPKIKISSTELVWVFHQRLEAFDDCPPEVPIAIVPDPDEGWMAVMSAQSRTHIRPPVCPVIIVPIGVLLSDFDAGCPIHHETFSRDPESQKNWPNGTR